MTRLLIALLVLGLPLAVWLDLTSLSEARLRRQAIDLNSVISSVRGYYASNVVGRVLSGAGQTRVAHNYENIPGAIPIPATLSLELGRVINEQQQNISYRFVSDYPFANRTPHVLDDFEKSALLQLRAKPDQQINETTSTYLTERVRLIAPVIMGRGLRELPQRASRKARSGTGRSATSAASRRSPSRRRSPPTSSRSNTCSPISSSWRGPA